MNAIRIIIAALLLYPFTSSAQKVYAPTLDKELIKITSKSLKPFVNNKYLEKKYHQSVVTFYNHSDGAPKGIKIDIPNYFYMKDGVTTTVTYKQEASGESSLLVGYVDGKKMALILLTLVDGSWNNRVVGVSYTDDYTKGTSFKTLGLLEYEIE
ncbi:hypothetical protein ACTJIJ_11760 [Niabella sp. 22666]|uniref:hypothetical protein n=1 Tax=Niabella sp. 22666 TaxID=3453954 RepID=UPI003F84B834